MRTYKDFNILHIPGMEPCKAYLSKEKIDLLNKTWAGTFRKHILPNLPIEKLYSNYSKTMGRPTKDLTTAMGAAILQQIFNLTDEETRHQLAFNQQWHYALETYEQKEQLYSEKTLWTVRHQLTQENIVQSIFNGITDTFADTFDVDTSRQRMDSVHVYSNMAKLGRVRLMARTVTKFLKNLKRHYKNEYKRDISEQLTDHYVDKKKSGYFGNVKPTGSQKRLFEIATDMQCLIEQYSDNEEIINMNSYSLMQRVISEQCVIKEGKMELKAPKEVASDSLQNPSDIDAAYDGHKGQGYQVQLAETYSIEDEDEEKSKETLDLIMYADLEPANKPDAKALLPAIDNMDERDVKPDEIALDTTYGGDDNVMAAEKKGVTVISPVAGKKSKKDFTGFEFNEKTKEATQCPHGKPPYSVKRNKTGTITAKWSEKDCSTCPFNKNCQTKKGTRGRRLHYSEKDIRLWQRRQMQESPEFIDKYRYRAGIEATNSRYIHMTGARRVRYRGQENVEFAEIMKALGINMFRVTKYINNSNKFLDFIVIMTYKSIIKPIFCIVKGIFNAFKEKHQIKSFFQKLLPIAV